MITIYKSNTFCDASNYVMDLLQRVDKTNLSVMHTVIVPDRTSLESERALLQAVKGSFNSQVRTFRRLANDILPTYDYLSKQSGIMALSGIIRDQKSHLLCYTKGTDTPGFVADMYDTISMLKYCKILPEQLLKNTLPRAVQGKAHDIAILYRAYLDYTANTFVDSADKLDLLTQEIPQSQTIKNGFFYLYDFESFTAQELAIVEQLMLNSQGVVVACCGNNTPRDQHLYTNEIFNGVLQLCKKNNLTPNIVEGVNHKNKYVEQIGKYLYHYGDFAPIACDNFLQIFGGETRLNEVYALACQVQDYVRQGGRFRDIYVVTSDVAKYTNIISTVFEEFEIPYFCDRQYCLADHPYARYVTDYISLCRNNGKLSYVLNFVKNYLFCGKFDENLQQDDDVFQFENYCLMYNVSYDYSKFNLGADSALFEPADRFRQKFNDLYNKIKFQNSDTVSNYVSAIKHLIELSDLDNKAQAFGMQQSKQGLSFEAKVTSQVATKFQQVLQQAERILGERCLSLDEFVKILATGLSSVNISVVPVNNDCVIFANMARARKHDIKFLALLGANYGVMPIVKSDCHLLSDKNIADLAKADVFVEPTILTENKRERFSLYQLLQEPTDKLYVSYCITDGQNSLTSSSFVTDLCKMFLDGGSNVTAQKTANEQVYTQRQAINKVLRNSRRQRDGLVVKMKNYLCLAEHFKDVIDKYQFNKDAQNLHVQNGSALYLKNSHTSASQIAEFYRCPYSFFFKYGLNVKPRTVSQLTAADWGNILHAVLEHYVAQVDCDETDQQTTQKANYWFDQEMSLDYYRGLKNDSRYTQTLAELKIEAAKMCVIVKKQLSHSAFKPLKTEMEYGPNGQLPAVEVPFENGKFLLKGKIDRTDVSDTHFVVIDYKSGSGAAEYKEKYLYIGEKLQLLIYVNAVQNGMPLKPAGYYYFNLHNDFQKFFEKKKYNYSGRTIKDVEIASQLDDILLQPLGESTLLGVNKNKSGGLSGAVLTEEQLQDQVRYAFELIAKAGNLMNQGYAAISPYLGKCQYCDYRNICGFNDIFHHDARNVTARIDAKDISTVISNLEPQSVKGDESDDQ